MTVTLADESTVAISGAPADIVVVQLDGFLPLGSAGHCQDVCELNREHAQLALVAASTCACSADGLERGEELTCTKSMDERAF